MGQKEMNAKSASLLSFLKKEYPNAKCALNFANDYECLTAILLSAQATDRSVNMVTPSLWGHYPDPEALSLADSAAIEKDIRPLGLSHSKALRLKALGTLLSKDFDGLVPHSFEKLIELPGVGKKTAGVFLIEREGRPAIPVDTHIARIAHRLRYCKEGEDPFSVEKRLEKSFPKTEWIFLHHALISFGRNICKAKKPKCEKCEMCRFCSYFRKTRSTIGK